MRASAALLTLLAACVPPAHAQAPPRLEPGVTQELARWRTTHYRDARYALRLRIDARKATAAGQMELRVKLARRVDLVLDWRGTPVRRLRVNGAPVRARHEKQHLGTKKCDVPLETCSAFGLAADFLIRNKLAREVTRSEMEENFARSRAKGLVLVADNVRANMKFVCHCCSCCCNLLETINEYGYPNIVVTSSYVAEIDAKGCSGCELCVETCPIHAISIEPAAGARPGGNGGATPPPKVDAALCLGCGVCALQCTTGACALKKRGQRVIHPETTFERLMLQCLEKGTLQNQIFDDPGRIDQKFMRAFVGAFLRLPAVKQALLSDRMRSRFLDSMRSGVRKQGKGWALEI